VGRLTGWLGWGCDGFFCSVISEYLCASTDVVAYSVRYSGRYKPPHLIIDSVLAHKYSEITEQQKTPLHPQPSHPVSLPTISLSIPPDKYLSLRF